jgi:hypothetical protein
VETLADRIAREGPINELDAVGWAIRLAKRIEAMHALGVTHGSMSPACVLIEGRDRAARGQLLDVRRSPEALACQSPERVNGGDLSQADDTWALACTLYAALTGNAAFTGSGDGELTQKILSATPAPLAVFDVGDDDLQRILDEAFARDLRNRTTSVAALRQALEEWHPDPNVGALPAVEDEGAGPGGTAEDDEDERTLMRASPVMLASHLHPGKGFPPPAGRAPAREDAARDEEDEPDERTLMRAVLERQPPPDLSGSAARSGAFTAIAPGQSGTFLTGGAAVPDTADDPHDEATLMRPSPALLAEDDDDQKTLMRSSLTPEEEAARLASPAAAPARPPPAAGAPAAAAISPGMAPLHVAAPLPPAAPLSPAVGVPGGVPSAGAPLVPATASPRRMGLWLAFVALLLAAGAAFAFLQMR